MKPTTKIIAAVAVIITVVVIALFSRGCNKPKVDTQKKTIDSLVNVIKAKGKEIEKQDEIIKYYAQAYDSTAEVNDSLAHVGTKTITKYLKVKAQADTVRILAVCDSLATEYEIFIDQTKQTLQAADSVMSAQNDQIGLQKGQILNYVALETSLKDRILTLEKEVDKLKKLAKRRGRAVEW